MQLFLVCLEFLGTAAFAVSGAMTALRKEMDIFGTCILGLTTAVGGGVLRDLLLGLTPPSTFRDPSYVFLAVALSIVVFLPAVQRLLAKKQKLFNTLMLLSDSAGLAIFTVYGAMVAIDAGFGNNAFLVVFVAVVTGVGGGVLRDVFAGDRPYIFIKHIYACAALAGAVACTLLWNAAGRELSMLAGFVLILGIRLCAARFRWSLPRAKPL